MSTADTPLLWVLRDVLRYDLGTKFWFAEWRCVACARCMSTARPGDRALLRIQARGRRRALATIEAIGTTSQWHGNLQLRRGSISMWCNADTANLARSCPAAALLMATPKPERCRYRRRYVPATSAGAEHISASAQRFTGPRAREQELTMSENASVSRLDRREKLHEGRSQRGWLGAQCGNSVAVETGVGSGFTATVELRSERFHSHRPRRCNNTGDAHGGDGPGHLHRALHACRQRSLEVDLDQVRLEHAPPNDALYANAILHVQTTGLSSSVRAFWAPLRQAGAVARTLIVSAAAKKWGVDAGTGRYRRA